MVDVLPCLARCRGKVTMNMLFLLCGGIALFGFGFLHKLKKIHQKDAEYFHFLYQFLNKKFKIALFQRLWVLGKTPLTLVFLTILTFFSWKRGIAAWGIYGLIAGLERGIKLLTKRARPFTSFPKKVAMLQPKRPNDFSFPSGDSLRVWFLALLLPAFLGLSWHFYLLSGAMALMVTLGRIAMGVHYPLDALSGTGLGLLGAGLAKVLWQVWGF